MLNYNSFSENFQKLLFQHERSSFLLALSGGVDSMVLANLMLENGCDFQVAHVNYKLRNEDSDLDQLVVQDFCKEHHINFHLYTVSEKDNKPKGSIQLWARELRYSFFKNILQKENLDCVVTAHHLNDQLESFFINLSRGAGLNGLSGIPENRDFVFRPLLPFTKKEIYDFAENNNIQFREDVSNAKNDYLRNKIRNTILPELINVSARFLEGFAKSIHYLAESQGFVEENMERIFQEIVVQKDNAWFIKTSELQSQSDFIKYNILKKFGMDSLAEIEKIFSAKSGAVFHSFQFLLSIDRETIYIREKSNIEKLPTSEIILVNDFQELQSSNFSISLSKYFLDYEGGVSGETWLFDADKLIFPLLLRKKKTGDVFYPKGMIGKKKVSKFFKDEKIPILAKSKIWLLVDGSDTVLGVLPIRQDRRQTPDNESVNALKIIL